MTAFDILRTLRPNQWTKNLVVAAAFFFALGDRYQGFQWRSAFPVIPAVLLFCLVSSGVYVLNDILDRNQDSNHPRKRHRPIASGAIPVPSAARLSALLLAAGLGGAWLLSPPFAAVVGTYLVLQLLYTIWLKHIALIDVMVIAAGFVLRAIAGAVVLQVQISPWLLLCAFLLALFLALCKRRQEKVVHAQTAAEHRPTLEQYDRALLDQLITMVGAAVIVSYAIYTLWPSTVDKFDTQKLGFTVPFVVFGIFRYLDLVYRHAQGERPEKVLLTDIPLLVDLALYGVTVLGIFLLR